VPFRSDEPSPRLYTPADPLARFAELHAALAGGRGWLRDHVPLRLAAVCLLTTPGDAAALADATRAQDAALRARLGWTTGVDAGLRLLIAAQVVKHGDDPERLLAEAGRVRALMRAAEVRRGGVYELLAVQVMRRVLGPTPIDAAHIERFRAIYEALKRHHWWLTGPEDFPTCAMLLARPDEPAAIGAGTEAIYQALHRRAGLWRGEALQTAAQVLYLGGAAPDELVDRFALLLAGFRAGGVRIGQGQYDELAILCLLAWPIERVLTTVLEFRGALLATQRWLGKASALNLAASLAFVRLVSVDEALGPLADAKLLLDMQAIITARQAAT